MVGMGKTLQHNMTILPMSSLKSLIQFLHFLSSTRNEKRIRNAFILLILFVYF